MTKELKIKVNGYWHHVKDLTASARNQNVFPEPNYRNTGMALYKITKMTLIERI